MREWKTIDSAPRDGTWFLARDAKAKWRDRPWCVVACWNLAPNNFANPRFEDRHGYSYGNLTHWMQMPDSPV